jgi:hypothetical protein
MTRVAQVLYSITSIFPWYANGRVLIPPPVWNASRVPTGCGKSTCSSSLSASTWIGLPPRRTHDGVV